MVECVDNGEEDWLGNDIDGEPFWKPKWELKINPKDNTITIKKIKDNWNRDELIALLDNCAEYAQINGNWQNPILRQKWLDKHL